MHNDLTFFTNEEGRNLYDRFNKILSKNTKFFDVLVGYFRTSGFYLMYPALEEVEKIRILVGINTDKKTVQIIEKSKEEQIVFDMSHKDVKQTYQDEIINEMKKSEDSYQVEKGVKTFIKWLQSGKIEIRVYPKAPIHAKVYIMRKDLDKVPDQYGSVITGSSNFSKAGLIDNLEFNVELKDSRDVQYALEKFEELWDEGIDISTEYIETIKEKTWIKDDITPYELFLKTLYEYFKEEINEDKNEQWNELLPEGFLRLQYQIDAVVQAKKTLDAYGGVFISDVVGLGKTYIAAMLARQLKGRKLIICPPVLIDYWEKVLWEFDVSARVESLGKLDKILDSDLDKYKYVFIDEAHRFRNQKTESYEKLHQICYNKKVILITATPQNNYSTDIANQIYLFQPKNNSTIIPNNKNLEKFFQSLESNLKKLEKGSDEYNQTLKNNSEQIRDQVLRHIMIRRTRSEVKEVYAEDLEKQGLKFPELSDPEKIIYEFNDHIEKVFNHTISIIKKLEYARYKPLTYLKVIDKNVASMMVSQRNMGGFMKSILVKRLESSFEAFKKTLHRFIISYEKFITMCESGKVFISKKIDVYDLMDNGDDETLMELVEEDKVQFYKIEDFNDEFMPALKRDLTRLRLLEEEWEEIIEDPKKDKFLYELKNNPVLKNKKIIIFTESKDTAEYVGLYLEELFPSQVIVFSGQSSEKVRKEIEANFDPKFDGQHKDDIQFLVTTDVLAEGINLHRSNVIVNYDLPWNPTKVMQRVGRINRVGTKHDKIYVFNFFPTAQANAELPLEENIISKIQAFHDTLGEDSKYLSDNEEVSSHQLYSILNSKDSLEGDEEGDASPQLYLKLIREIRDQQPDLFVKIKNLPLKSKTGRKSLLVEKDSTISFVRKGALKKFFITDGEVTTEKPFLSAIKYFECKEDEKRILTPKVFFDHLNKNKKNFEQSFVEVNEIITEAHKKTGRDSQVIKLLKALSKVKTFTEKEEKMIRHLRKLWEDGNIPSTVTNEVVKKTKGIKDPIKIYYEIINIVPDRYIENNRILNKKVNVSGDIEVILSSYLKKGVNE